MELTQQDKKYASKEYNHARLERRRWFLRFLIKNIGFTLLAKQGPVEGLENVPREGPALIMINHISFADPIAVINVLPRNMVPMAKIEAFNYPLVGIFPKLWEVIPVRRDEIDRSALQQAFAVLKAGELVMIAPEGTRSPQLKPGRDGVAYIASRANVPIVPTAVDGSIGFPALRPFGPWKTSGISIKFGRPFRYKPEYLRAGREHLRKMTDEAMYILAAMLPEERRGYYSDLSKATEDTIIRL